MLNASIGVVIYLSSLDITDVEPFIFIQGGCFSGRSAQEREREEGKVKGEGERRNKRGQSEEEGKEEGKVKGEGERRNKRGQSEEERKSGGEGAEERGKEKRTTKE